MNHALKFPLTNQHLQKKVKYSSPQLNTFLEQKPITYIDDTTAPIGDLNFPSVTICNINQVKHTKKTLFCHGSNKE